MWLFVFTVLSYIGFGFFLDVSSRNDELINADIVKRIDATMKALASNYHNLLITVQNDRSEIDTLIKQNQGLNQRLYTTVDKMEKLITNEEFLNQTIQALQTLTSEQQRELNKEKSMSKKMESNYNDLLFKVNREVDFLKDQNHYLEQKLNSTVEKMEKLMSEEETSSQNIVALQNITSQQQRDLDKEKFKSITSRVSVGSSLILLNNSLQELTHSTNIGFTNLNGNDLKEKQLLREEMRKFEKRIKRRINKRLDNTVDGQWSSWIDTPSSVTCGVGCRLRYRECSNPYPEQGGKKCGGSRNKYVKCLQYDPCPVHGAWSVWSENTCSVTCGVGTRLRSRNCSNPHPQYGGNNCTGNSTDHVTCTQPNKCRVHGAWSVWSENTCSVTCGVGTRLRSRNCSNPHPQYGGNSCTGNGTDHVTCTQPNECPGVIVTSLKIKNKELILNEGETAVFDCVVVANTAVRIHWTRGSQDIPSKAVIDRGRLTIPNTVLADADTYICSVPTSPRSSQDRASLLVIPVCEPNQFSCRDGTCITETYRCDSYADCNDRSDEENCPGGPCRTGQYVCDDGSCARQGSGCNFRTECRDGSDEFPKYCGCPSLRQFQCRDGTKCIDTIQECDGISDCTDRSDEHSRCVSTCRPDEFRCSDGACINLVKECDGVRDCVDNSDENNCLDGKWTAWVEEPCSVTCGIGARLRHRQCSNPYPQNSGKKCTGNDKDKITCTQPSCLPVDTLECDGGWIKRDDFGASYCFSNKTLSWDKAQEQCGTQNSSLADIYSENEAVWIEDSCREHSGNFFWIGGKRDQGIFKWFTHDGQTKNMNYTGWAKDISPFFFSVL